MSTTPPEPRPIAFIGGGNMAVAMIGGLIAPGADAPALLVVEPDAAARERLQQRYGIVAMPAASERLRDAAGVVWAVKPQTFEAAAAAVRPHLAADALHLSIAAGIRSDTIAQWLATDRVVRAMPNTPALVGRGMTGLYARAAVPPDGRQWAESVLARTGEVLWFGREEQLDAVTALSGSGPAYVFYFLEAMVRAGAEMGLDEQQARRLAVGTFAGAAELARTAPEPLRVLRENVTSKGGTTHAALTVLDERGVGAAFAQAMHAACRRAAELGDASAPKKA